MVCRCLFMLTFALVPSLALAQDGGADAGELDAGMAVDDGGQALMDAGAADEDAGILPDEDAGMPPDDDAGMPPDDDAGTPPDPVDGGMMPTDCQMRCEGNVLRYCDAVTGEPLSIDCEELEARCGILSDDWGLDCLLPEGAACSSGYAEGRSRCDPGATANDPPLFCSMNTCQTTPGDDVIPDVPSDSGGLGDTLDDDPNPLACLGCPNNSLPFGLTMLFTLLGLRQLTPEARRRRRARRPAR